MRIIRLETHIWKPALYSLAAAFVVSLVSFSHAPELVAFQNSTDAKSEFALSAAKPAHAMLASDVRQFETQPIATLATFRENSLAPVSQPGEKPSARPMQSTKQRKYEICCATSGEEIANCRHPSTDKTANTQNSARLWKQIFISPKPRYLPQRC